MKNFMSFLLLALFTLGSANAEDFSNILGRWKNTNGDIFKISTFGNSETMLSIEREARRHDYGFANLYRITPKKNYVITLGKGLTAVNETFCGNGPILNKICLSPEAFKNTEVSPMSITSKLQANMNVVKQAFTVESDIRIFVSGAAGDNQATRQLVIFTDITRVIPKGTIGDVATGIAQTFIDALAVFGIQVPSVLWSHTEFLEEVK